MNEVVKFSQVEEKIFSIRGQKLILDSDVAELYDVETRDINKSVKNNPTKFPEGYIFKINHQDLSELRWKNSTTNVSTMTRAQSKVFTKKGCNMLATIVSGEKATQTTIAIIEAFEKMDDLRETITKLSKQPEEQKQKTLMQKSGEIFADLLGDDLAITDTETTIEVNFAPVKFKHTIKRK